MKFFKQNLLGSLVVSIFIVNTVAQVESSDEIPKCVEENIATISEAKKTLAKDKIRVVGQVSIPTVFDYKKDTALIVAYAMANGGNEKTGKIVKVFKPKSKTEFEIKLYKLDDLFTGKSNYFLEGGESVAFLRNCQVIKRKSEINFDFLKRIFPIPFFSDPPGKTPEDYTE